MFNYPFKSLMKNFLRNKISFSLVISSMAYAAYPAIAEAGSVVRKTV